VESIGLIDTASKEVKEKEKREELEAEVARMRKKEKKRKNKMRGKGKAGHIAESKLHQTQEAVREKNKVLYKKEYEKQKLEGEQMKSELEFLGKIEGKFDPVESYFESKRRRKE